MASVPQLKRVKVEKVEEKPEKKSEQKRKLEEIKEEEIPTQPNFEEEELMEEGQINSEEEIEIEKEKNDLIDSKTVIKKDKERKISLFNQRQNCLKNFKNMINNEINKINNLTEQLVTEKYEKNLKATYVKPRRGTKKVSITKIQEPSTEGSSDKTDN